MPRFRALVCADEQWLRSEFDGIVSGPAEHLHAGRPVSGVAAARSGPGTGGGKQRGSAGLGAAAAAVPSAPRSDSAW
jgi:hypothetical protein